MRFVLPRTFCYEKIQYKEAPLGEIHVPVHLCQFDPSPPILRAEIACLECDSIVTGIRQTTVWRSLNRMCRRSLLFPRRIIPLAVVACGEDEQV
jgi:hypothetical protein